MIRRTVAQKHVIAFISLVAIPVLLVFLFISHTFRSEMLRIARDQSKEAVQRTAQNLDIEAMNFALFTAALINDETLNQEAERYIHPKHKEDRYQASKGIEKSIAWFFRITSRIGSVFIFFTNGENYKFSNYPNDSIDFDYMRSLCMDPTKADGVVWNLDTLNTIPGSVEKDPVLSMVVRPPHGQSTSIAAILVSFHVPLLDNFTRKVEDSSSRFILNANGNSILSNNNQNNNIHFKDLQHQLQKDHIIIKEHIESLNWDFIEAIPTKHITQKVDVITRLIFASIGMIIIFFALYTRSFFSGIINPLRKVINQMEQFAKGDFSVRVQEEGPDEFKELGITFNNMVYQINDLTQKIVESHKEKTRLEIEALRFQLNPHFICNTLTSIGMMASIARVEPIKKMTSALTRIIEETLMEEDTLIPIEKELKNLESYVYIMKVRFGDTFNYHTRISGNFKNLGIPTMLIQPVIENAILHGMRGKKSGNIWLNFNKDDPYVYISIQDDGNGIPLDKQETLFHSAKDGKRGLNRIGLYNIRQRIVLSYPPPCDITVESWPGEGTLVTICIPQLSMEVS
jgi:two-component system sensor histidine kinase YesM